MYTEMFLPPITVTLPNTRPIRQALSQYRKNRNKGCRAQLQNALLHNQQVRDAMKTGDYEKVYSIIAPVLDKNGFHRYWAAERLTGVDIHSYFYAEDTAGRFEAADGNELLHWLESAAFGTVDWTQAAPGVEKAEKHSIDTLSEAYAAHRKALHRDTVRELLGFSHK